MSAAPRIETRDEQPYAAITTTVTMDEMGTALPPLNPEVVEWLATQGAKPVGPPMWKYNVIDMSAGLEIEVGVSTSLAVEGDDRVNGGTLPAGRYAVLRHVGHPSTLMEATGGLLDWAEAQGLRWDTTDTPEGERWAARIEFYLSDPDDEPDMNKWETELAFKLAD
jgi:effector-binding domain-containing protein